MTKKIKTARQGGNHQAAERVRTNDLQSNLDDQCGATNRFHSHTSILENVLIHVSFSQDGNNGFYKGTIEESI